MKRQKTKIKIRRAIEETYWDYAAPSIKYLKSPWRPHFQDISIMEEIVENWAKHHVSGGNIYVLVLGVTPEIVNMNWPLGSRLTVMDKSEGMIRTFYSDNGENRELRRGNWLELKGFFNRFHFVIGDGVFNTFSYPNGFNQLAEIISQILIPGGLFITRVFTQSNPKEKPEELIELVKSRKIERFHEFTFRFLIACQTDVKQGLVHTPDIFERKIYDQGLSLSEIYEITQYEPPYIPNVIRPSGTDKLEITYPTQEQFIAALSDYLELSEIRSGDYPSGGRCPISSWKIIN